MKSFPCRSLYPPWKFVFLALAMCGIIGLVVPGAAYDLTACGEINLPGLYTLQNDILDSPLQTCISINSSDVIFNGNGFTIDGTDNLTSQGVYVYRDSVRLTNVSVRNVVVTGWGSGISYREVDNGRIESNTGMNNKIAGIDLTDADYSLITGNTMMYTGNNRGIFLRWVKECGPSACFYMGSDHNTIFNNTVLHNGQGITLWLSDNNSVSSNMVENNGWWAIGISGSANNSVVDNTINSNEEGITLEITHIPGTADTFPSMHNTVMRNTVTNNVGGIALDGSSLNEIRENVVTNNTVHGLYLFESNDNTLYNNYLNNTVNSAFGGSIFFHNIWNTTKIVGTNVVGGLYVAGNYWGTPDGLGYSQTCSDGNEDGICDSGYFLTQNNTDWLPLRLSSSVQPSGNVTTCTELATPGTYTLQNDILESPEPSCIKITSSDVSFDGNGYIIDGVDTLWTAGVAVYNPADMLSNITVRNVTVSDWGGGIYFRAQNGIIERNLATSNVKAGIHLNLSSNENTIRDNIVLDNGEFGIAVATSQNDLVVNNTVREHDIGIFITANDTTLLSNVVENNRYYGINIDNATGITMQGNRMGNNTYNFRYMVPTPQAGSVIDTTNLVGGKPIYYLDGAEDRVLDASTNAGLVHCLNCRNVTIQDLTLSRNAAGVVLYNSSFSLVHNCTVHSNEVRGILVRESDHIIVDSNNAYNTSLDGIFVVLSPFTEVRKNTVYNNGLGIEAWRSENCTITENQVHHNLLAGITLRMSNSSVVSGNTITDTNATGMGVMDSTWNLIQANTFTHNAGDGLWLWNTTYTLITKNTASNNTVHNGISLGNSHYNTVSDNTASLNYHNGIIVYNGSTFNQVLNNTAYENGDAGIHAREESNSNWIINNTVFSNSWGIGINGARNNKICLNTIHDNILSNGASDAPNFWNSHAPIRYLYQGTEYVSQLGNSWGDYTGADTNGNGVGEDPYFISTDNVDNNPLVSTSQNYEILQVMPTSSLLFKPNVTSIAKGSTTSVDVLLQDNPYGLSGYNITIALTNGSIGEIMSVTMPLWAGLAAHSSLPADTVWIKAADLSDQIKPGYPNVTLASIVLRGDTAGSTPITLTSTQIDDDFGGLITPTLVNGILTVSSVLPLPGQTNPPTDPDGDGLYEDLNGNGRKDFQDVVLFFTWMEWIAANEPLSAFDFNNNTRIDFNDIVRLFEEI